jgi:transcriptional regulator with XRE-family HTH domain
MDQQAFGNQLRKLRRQAGLSQEILAERAGVSVASIAAYERNRRLRPYPHTLRALASALGLTPDEQAALLDSVSREATISQASDVAPPVSESANRPSNVRLPNPPTTLFGRDGELASVASKIRLLTLRGPGGVGKTRLALGVADALVAVHADGVVFIDLSSVRDHRLVAATIAQALNVHESPGRSARELLLERLAQLQLLLVLDNFEHLLGAAPLVAELLANCSRLAMLITSRTPLRVRAEHGFNVGPLALPPAGATPDAISAAAAVCLFVDRARATNPAFELNDRSAPLIAAICRRLDGIPLAIELAAARVGLLGAEALLRRLERSSRVLGRGAADLPERQQTLGQTLDWSHALLEPLDSCTADSVASSSTEPCAVHASRVAGGATTYRCSARRRRAVRLVTSNRNPRQLASRSASRGASWMTCSKLSRTISVSRARR